MKNLEMMDWTAIAFLIIGGINWGSIALFNIDFVSYLLGEMTVMARVAYGLVAASALYMLYRVFVSVTFDNTTVPYIKTKNVTL